MFTNESLFDRSIRIMAGIAFALLAWIAWPGATAILAAVASGVATVTGFAGWCPVYTLLDVSTKEKSAV